MTDALITRAPFKCSACDAERPAGSMCYRAPDLHPAWQSCYCHHGPAHTVDVLLCADCFVAWSAAGREAALAHLRSELTILPLKMAEATAKLRAALLRGGEN